jgi:2'-5' RNA ligase
MRLFTAIVLEGAPSDNLRGFLAFAQGLDLPVKWVIPEQLHLTLVFFGETPTERLGPLDGVLRTMVFEPGSFDLELGGLGAFPNLKKPQSLFVGLRSGMDAVRKLHQCMSESLTGAGFQMEKRNFHPHVTLGRVREEISSPEGMDRLLKAAPPTFGKFKVKEFRLIESKLTPRGSVYTDVSAHPLGTGTLEPK